MGKKLVYTIKFSINAIEPIDLQEALDALNSYGDAKILDVQLVEVNE